MIENIKRLLEIGNKRGLADNEIKKNKIEVVGSSQKFESSDLKVNIDARQNEKFGRFVVALEDINEETKV